ncbi:uncharacterized protein LOC123548987 [Mercenaria mercenaria]|uniref:uncharacterized protein LOC123548987 n=1 Tax=Mercenaria mercenaria TaxID=6596 RepID=UPI00234F7F68|nr:uncharacterized protein LOC123548987 [Mercenaria mercenaria]
MAEPEAEAESEVEPESESEAEPEATGSASTEPEPYWPLAFQQWGSAWHLHTYSVACIFMFIAILAAMSMVVYLKNKQVLKQVTLTFTLQCLLLYFTLLRSLVMFINPYQTADKINDIVFRMMWSFSLPGLTAAFSVLLLVFLDTTKMTLGPPVFQKLSVLLIFTACHFVIVVSADIICALVKSSCAPMLMFCQALFILYGTLLAAGYAYTAISLHRKCVTGVISAEENRKIIRLIKISGFASCIALSIAVTHLYAACSEFGIYSDVIYVNAWDWWILQSVLRFEEITSSCLILVIAFRNPFAENGRIRNWILKSINRKTNPLPQTDVTQIDKTQVT